MRVIKAGWRTAKGGAAIHGRFVSRLIVSWRQLAFSSLMFRDNFFEPNVHQKSRVELTTGGAHTWRILRAAAGRLPDGLVAEVPHANQPSFSAMEVPAKLQPKILGHYPALMGLIETVGRERDMKFK